MQLDISLNLYLMFTKSQNSAVKLNIRKFYFFSHLRQLFKYEYKHVLNTFNL